MTESIASALLGIFVFHGVAFAEADGPDFWDINDVADMDVLNIREEPNWRSRKIGEIPHNGRCVKNLGCIGGLTLEEYATLSDAERERIQKERPRWCKILYQGQPGWASGHYLQEARGPCERAGF